MQSEADSMIDAHNHLDFAAFDQDRTQVVAEARATGVDGFVLSGTHPRTWARTVAIARATGGHAVVGVHPGWAHEVDDWDDIAAALPDDQAIGIGEIGLDRRVEADLAWQKAGLRLQLAIARDQDLPVVFHCVRAYPELLATIRADGLPARGGMIHSWTGPPDRVAEALALGLTLSFGPAITRTRAPNQVASVRQVPLDRLLVETDSPDQRPPGSDRGVPADLSRVVQAVANARGTPVDVVATATHDNAERLFGLGRLP